MAKRHRHLLGALEVEKAKPRKITINQGDSTNQAITAGHNGNGKQRNDNTVEATVNG